MMTSSPTLTITTANVNGIRAAARKGITEWITRTLPDILCLQEVRAPQDVVDSFTDLYTQVYREQNKTLLTYNQICTIKGRAGVALFTTYPTRDVRYGLPGLTEDVDTGRWLEADIQLTDQIILTVISVYIHSGNVDDPLKMMQKYRFLDAMNTRLTDLYQRSLKNPQYQVAICGDFNIAHTEHDLKNPKSNRNSSGFLLEERQYVDYWLNHIGFIDTMRSLTGDIQGPYTWWSQRGRAFDNNAGWRLDYQMDTPLLAHAAQNFMIDKAPTYDQRWSDHAPLTISYSLNAINTL